MIKKIGLGLLLVTMAAGCHAKVQVQAKTPEKQEAKAEPAPPPPAEPKAGEQISLPDQIEFESNQAKIKQTPKTLDTLNALADLMKKHPHITKLRIEGHTDNVGSDKLNEKLSKARADAVAKWLSQHEVDAKRMTTAGFGAKVPVKPNDSAENRALNRRTEYYVDQVDGKKVEGDGKSIEEPADTTKASAKTDAKPAADAKPADAKTATADPKKTDDKKPADDKKAAPAATGGKAKQ